MAPSSVTCNNPNTCVFIFEYYILHFYGIVYFPLFFSYPNLDECEQNKISCYGAPTTNPANGCCKTCTDVKIAYTIMDWILDLPEISQCLGRFISFQWASYMLLFLSLDKPCK